MCCSTSSTPHAELVGDLAQDRQQPLDDDRRQPRGSSRRPAAAAGRPISARPTASICCSPPESSAGLAVQAAAPASGSSRRPARACGSDLSPRGRGAGSRATVSSKNSARSSGTWARPRRATLWAARPATGSPSDVTVPRDRRQQARDRSSSVVVLPAPLGPSSATTSPASTCQVEVAHDGDAAVAGVQSRRRAAERRGRVAGAGAASRRGTSPRPAARRPSCRGRPRSPRGRRGSPPACPRR